MQKRRNWRELPLKQDMYKFQDTIASKRSVSGPEKEIPWRPGLLVKSSITDTNDDRWHCEVNVSSMQMNACGTWVTLLLTHLSQQLLQRPGCMCLSLAWYGCIEGPKWPDGRVNALILEVWCKGHESYTNSYQFQSYSWSYSRKHLQSGSGLWDKAFPGEKSGAKRTASGYCIQGL